MDRSNDLLLIELKDRCSLRLDGHWELLATAAGNESSIQKTLVRLNTEELIAGSLEVGSTWDVEERIYALSVSQPSTLYSLFEEWRQVQEDEDRWIDSIWLDKAIKTAHLCFGKQTFDPNLEPWFWNNKLHILSFFEDSY
jgi:hypothetical protein